MPKRHSAQADEATEASPAKRGRQRAASPTPAKSPRKAAKKKSAQTSYKAEDIQVLEGLEPIRRRPAMYLGGTDLRALHLLVETLLEISIEQHRAGQVSSISVTLQADGGICVDDDGPGIPIHWPHEDKITLLEALFTQACHRDQMLRWQHDSPKTAVGIGRGVEAQVVNALSEHLLVENTREGHLFCLEYRRGKPVGGLVDRGLTERRGTRITSWPDPTIFPSVLLDHSMLADRLRELSCLLPALSITFQDERRIDLRARNGFVALLDRLRGSWQGWHEALSVAEMEGGVEVAVALQWIQTQETIIHSFANLQRTPRGGSHVEGLLGAIREQLGVAESYQPQGLIAAVSVVMHEVHFAGPTKNCLQAREAQVAVHAVTSRLLGRFFAKSPVFRTMFAR